MGLVMNERLATFWRMVYERQMIWIRRRAGQKPPWTHDPVLGTYRFTLPYRAADRVSQYLIQNVAYRGLSDPQEMIFRVLLFRIFNNVATYQALEREYGRAPNFADFNPTDYGFVLHRQLELGRRVWGAAYRMTGLAGELKHDTFLRTLQNMRLAGTFGRIVRATRARQIYDELHSWPLISDFLSMQYTTDLLYTEAVDPSLTENDFIVPGRGARRGAARLCAGYAPEAVIHWLADNQDEHLSVLELDFPWLGGSRRLSLMDVQNVLCEFDKYCRVAHPDWEPEGVPNLHAGAPRQRYRPSDAAPLPLYYWFPPRWGLNDGEL